MKTTNELVKQLKQHGVLIIQDNMRHTLPDLTFALECLCIPFNKREVETPNLGRVVKIKMGNIH